jgi:uncharacterized lipoprotein YmbA
MRALPNVPLVGLAALCALTAGCLTLGGGSHPTNFYLLSAMPQEDAEETSEAAKLLVGVGPIAVPEYLNRSQLVVRTGTNELRLDELHQWAEPLADGIARVVAANLTELLPVEAIYFPWRSSRSIDYQLVVQVASFETDPAGAATLELSWAIRQPGTSERLMGRSDVYRIEGTGTSSADRVSAMSQALEAFSRDVAAVLRAQLR